MLDEYCKVLIETARRLDRHDVLLRVCAELSETGQHDNKTRRLEVELVSNYEPDRALLLAKKYEVFDPYFSVVRNYLAAALQQA